MACIYTNKNDQCDILESGKCGFIGNTDQCTDYLTDNECSDCGVDLDLDECECLEEDLYECTSCFGLFYDNELNLDDLCYDCTEDDK